MHTKRTIALVGSGILAKALSASLIKGNNRVLIFSRIHEDAKCIVSAIKNKNSQADLEAIECSYTASWEADIIITVIPYPELKDFVSFVKDVAVQKIFIVGETADDHPGDIDSIQHMLPFTKIIHAYFNIKDDGLVNTFLNEGNDEAIKAMHDLFKEARINILQKSNNSLLSLINH